MLKALIFQGPGQSASCILVVGIFRRMVTRILLQQACPSFAVAWNVLQLPGDYQSEDFEDMLVEMQSDDVVGFGRS